MGLRVRGLREEKKGGGEDAARELFVTRTRGLGSMSAAESSGKLPGFEISSMWVALHL